MLNGQERHCKGHAGRGVGGVMNLLWVIVLSTLVATEKLLPAELLLPKIAGAALILGDSGEFSRKFADCVSALAAGKLTLTGRKRTASLG